MAVKPLHNGKPTLQTLAIDVSQLHDCLEEHRGETKEAFAGIDGQLKVITANLGSMMAAVGIKEPQPDTPTPALSKKTLATMTPWQIGWRALGTMGAALPLFFFLIQALNAAWPSVVGFFTSINNMIVSQ